ncbi:MAG: hypothetical protein U9Q03_02055 [Patescibacteria group bacterium]|nr:hypothetical protein [Patescibacteria group bacterium]
MHTALIGHTGFVGSNLDRQHKFTHKYNSKNIDRIDGQKFDLVVCSGVNAIKWQANKDPKADWDGIEKLLVHLNEVTADRFVLISTIDVYQKTAGVDEDSPIDPDSNHAYGHHRYLVEEFVRRTFPVRHVVRLPGLFGEGLKKNVIFDLLNDNCLEMINDKSSFQYYPLARLWNDIHTATKSELDLVNFATEPIDTADIIDAYFSGKFDRVGADAGDEAHYDIGTKYAGSFGRDGRYMLDQSAVMESLGGFINDYGQPA